MENLAAYAVMASASVGLCKELLFPYEDDQAPLGSDSSSFLHSRLAALRRQEDEDDDMTVALLSTMWQDEIVACLAADNNSSGQDHDLPPEEEKIPERSSPSPPPSSSRLKRSRQQSLAPRAPYEDEFGLRLNLDSGSYAQQQFEIYPGSTSDHHPRRVHHFDTHHEDHPHALRHRHHQSLSGDLAEHPFLTPHHFPGAPSRDWPQSSQD
ncbi:hypothetical protein SELMODRAFT_408837 [Selaginella moellendorffii]|uniref:Uncharacterized protein n=1 Tax=Selaginella moellendorffii TaxID=88036 RepID=D8RA43_SELML|nr:uncharacterized protein LOC9633090 [Selaginella moellendorffii]EFJ31002.1 hypothetical protein SELMODRAFT_408837 [Selaginella moellendorffii]|eukprot:XP_002967655.1 uncharacterized protein LOC9633090 [Selaginella moellendorffii]